MADAGAAVESAKSALNQAKRDVKNGKLQANAIDDYKANLAAATTQLGQATLSAAASAAAAAATTGTGGFYASGSAEKTIVEKTSTNTEERYIGSNFNVGGDASFDATDSIDIIGSGMDIGGGLALNAKDVTIKAGTEETTSTSSETTRTAGTSYSTNGGASANLSGSNTDADSYSKTHINSSINAGSLTSTSENLTLSGANVEVAGGIDIDTGNLVIESLQDESSSSSKTEGYSASANIGGDKSISPGNFGANENSSNADSKWVNNQTTLIGGTSGSGDVNISADKTTLKGAVVASATRNEDGSLTDNGTLNLATDELIIEDLKDKDHSESKGFDVSTSVGYNSDNPDTKSTDEGYLTGSTTIGLTSDGHKKEQNTLATLGGGNITKKDGSAHEEGLVESANSDLNNSQEITKDMKTGGLNATVVVDHRLVSENGLNDIAEDFEKSGELTQEVGNGLVEVTQIDNEEDSAFYSVLNGITTNTGGLLAEIAILIGQGDIKNQQIQVVSDGSAYMEGREGDFQPIENSEYYQALPEDKQALLKDKNLFVTKKDVQITMDTSTYQNATNGMLNNEGLAIINAMQQTSETDKNNKVIGDVAFTLNYNPTHGVLADALESGVDTSGLWTTGIAKQTGEFYRDVTTAQGTDGSNFNNHSQGNILTQAGINYINDKGSYEEGGFKPKEHFVDEAASSQRERDKGIPSIAGFGSPVNTVDMRETVVIKNGFNFQGMLTHEGDFVGEGIGGNKGDNGQASFSDKLKVKNVLDLFGEGSPHSTYGCSENGNAKCGEL